MQAFLGGQGEDFGNEINSRSMRSIQKGRFASFARLVYCFYVHCSLYAERMKNQFNFHLFVLRPNLVSLVFLIPLLSPTLGYAWTCGDALVDERDAQSYGTVLIGDQCWMAKNLNVGTMTGGTVNQTDNGTIEKYCYANNPANCETYGGLYQWNEAMQYSTTPAAQGICAMGWHIPTHDEFTTLERAVCTSGTCETDFPYDTTTAGFRGTNEGTVLKVGGNSGFEGLLSGRRLDGG